MARAMEKGEIVLTIHADGRKTMNVTNLNAHQFFYLLEFARKMMADQEFKAVEPSQMVVPAGIIR